MKLGRESELSFEWRYKGHEIDTTHCQKIRCKNAVNRGVSFPKHWRTAIKFVADVAKLLQKATTHASRKAENSIVTCKLLGIPVDDDRLDALCGAESGSLVSLQGLEPGTQTDFVLVAHVLEDTWICHPGSDTDGRLCTSNPFDLKDLVVKNIRQDRTPEDATSRTRRRVSRKQPGRDLLGAAESNP